MFDYERYFNEYCKDNGLDLTLSFDMPEGYESANGTFDLESGTVYINAAYLNGAPDYEQAFYLIHELRHAAQYLRSDLFSDAVRRSIPYVIQYDGTCYKTIDGQYLECQLEGGEEVFTNIYLGQPYEVDANTYAYERTKEIFGDSPELRRLYESWMPTGSVPDDVYDSVYARIDERIQTEE